MHHLLSLALHVKDKGRSLSWECFQNVIVFALSKWNRVFLTGIVKATLYFFEGYLWDSQKKRLLMLWDLAFFFGFFLPESKEVYRSQFIAWKCGRNTNVLPDFLWRQAGMEMMTKTVRISCWTTCRDAVNAHLSYVWIVTTVSHERLALEVRCSTCLLQMPKCAPQKSVSHRLTEG